MAELPLRSLLDEAGLNRQHVFDMRDLPSDLTGPLQPGEADRQLILLGHAGRQLWKCVKASGMASDHPIDDYSEAVARRWLAQALPQVRARIVFPSGLAPGQRVGLQRLGQLAGWHHASPFFVGIDAHWGSWFAYRVVILADSELPASRVQDHGNPCPGCERKPCITACEGGALDGGTLDAEKCHHHRLKVGSACALGCSARLACPVGMEHRYERSQIEHSARGSLAAIRRYYTPSDDAS